MVPAHEPRARQGARKRGKCGSGVGDATDGATEWHVGCDHGRGMSNTTREDRGYVAMIGFLLLKALGVRGCLEGTIGARSDIWKDINVGW